MFFKFSYRAIVACVCLPWVAPVTVDQTPEACAQLMDVRADLVMQSSVVHDPSSLWPDCIALWWQWMSPWPFGNSKWSVKLHVANL